MQQVASQYPVLFAICVMAAFWVAIGLFFSWITGWRLLAERYRTDRQFPAHKRWMQSVRMRAGIRFNHALTLGSDAEGLYMGMTLSLFPGHPRLFVPWADVVVEEPKQVLFLMMRTLRLGPDRIPLRMRETLAEFLLSERGASAQEDSRRWGSQTELRS